MLLSTLQMRRHEICVQMMNLPNGYITELLFHFELFQVSYSLLRQMIVQLQVLLPFELDFMFYSFQLVFKFSLQKFARSVLGRNWGLFDLWDPGVECFNFPKVLRRSNYWTNRVFRKGLSCNFLNLENVRSGLGLSSSCRNLSTAYYSKLLNSLL